MASTNSDRHKRYRCKSCSKEDRKGRMVAHVLKHHVSMDQAPFYCSLCSFRCTEKKQLTDHLTKYKRHREEAARREPQPLGDILHFSLNPVNVDEHMVPVAKGTTTPMVEEDIFAQDEEEPSLPDWLLETTIRPARPGTQPTSVVSIKGPTETMPLRGHRIQGEVQRPALPTPVPVLMMPPIHQGPILSTPAPVLRTPQIQSQVNIPPLSQPACQLESPGMSATPWSTVTSEAPADPFPTIDSFCWGGLLDAPALSIPSPQPNPPPGVTVNLRKGQIIPSKSMVLVPESPQEDPGTPLQDEPEGHPVVLQPTLSAEEEKDPLCVEGRKVEQSKKSAILSDVPENKGEGETKTSLVIPPEMLDLFKASLETQRAILEEVKSTKNEMRRLSKTVSYLWDEVKDVRRNVASLENARWTALKRARSPLKSVVVKPKKQKTNQ